jgi:photosynthetic reaction center cytochrome c subunit
MLAVQHLLKPLFGVAFVIGTTMTNREPGRPTRVSAPAAARDTISASRDSMMNAVLKQIAGREALPAESVFKNIRISKGRPAGQLLRVMNLGYGRSLGVSCSHCHVVTDWSSDDKPQKQIARDMANMVGRINGELLAAIPNLKGPQPIVNCTTCHRGDVKPALNLPPGN